MVSIQLERLGYIEINENIQKILISSLTCVEIQSKLVQTLVLRRL